MEDFRTRLTRASPLPLMGKLDGKTYRMAEGEFLNEIDLEKGELIVMAKRTTIISIMAEKKETLLIPEEAVESIYIGYFAAEDYMAYGLGGLNPEILDGDMFTYVMPTD